MAVLFYNIFIWFYATGVRLASAFNPKAKLWITGRKHWQQQLRDHIKPGDKVLWMHCSSLGEFEQGRPILEKWRITNGEWRILLTFYSPSGYEVRKDYKGADLVMYLPLDSASNAKEFLELAHPSIAMLVKYEFWYNILSQIKKKNIPCFLVSGIFRKDQLFFHPLGGFFRKMLKCFDYFFVQNEESKHLLEKIGLGDRTMISGDTRFDRVKEIAGQFEHIPIVQQFTFNQKTIIAGSTWLNDDELLAKYAKENKDIKLIIAPHEIDESRIKKVMELYPNATKFSLLEKDATQMEKQVLVIDNIGMLTRLYAYGTITYVGGAFDKEGVHNVLEPAVYAKPVVFGPVYDKYSEAVELIQLEGAVHVKNYEELEICFDRLMSDGTYCRKVATAAGDYVQHNTGATQKTLSYLKEKKYF